MCTDKVQDFLKKSKVDDIISDLDNHFEGKEFKVSDVTDDFENQYVDLVQEGGGVWGVALLGYTYVLEQMGIRFFSLAGTSAGAINTMALAAIESPSEEDLKNNSQLDDKSKRRFRTKTDKILEIMLKKDLFDLVDGKGNKTVAKWIKNRIKLLIKIKNYGAYIKNIILYGLGNLIVSTLLVLIFSYTPYYESFCILKGFSLFLWILFIGFITLCIVFYLLVNKGFGLNKGEDFKKWIEKDVLIRKDEKGNIIKDLNSLDNLKKQFQILPNLKLDTNAKYRAYNSTKKVINENFKKALNTTSNFENILEETIQDIKPNSNEDPPDIKKRILMIVSCDVTTGNKIEFPRMWDLYYDKISDVKPVDFVRASMSIPLFFDTYTIKPYDGKLGGNDEKLKIWEDKLKWDKKYNIPSEVKFVDGGAISNFPINVFYNPKHEVPRMPTFGIRLSSKKESGTHNLKNLFSYLMSVVSTIKENTDKEFLNKNKAFNKGIGYVEIDLKYSWLNFFMTDKEKIELFLIGAKAASDFLKGFDWERYKKERILNSIDSNPNNW